MSKLWGVVACALVFTRSAFALEVVALALFQDAALLELDGRQQLLRVGQTSPAGIHLLSASPREAVVVIDGKRRHLVLDQRISGEYQQREAVEISIARNSRRQYLTSAAINGQTITVLVDTGANTVAMSASHAQQLGIDYRRGEPRSVATASGVSPAFAVNLREVDVGGIAVNNVPAVVIDGGFPLQVLLGTSYLEHVLMREENGVMYLKERY